MPENFSPTGFTFTNPPSQLPRLAAYTLSDGRTLIVSEASPRSVVDTRKKKGAVHPTPTIEALVASYEATTRELRAAADRVRTELAEAIREREAMVERRAERIATKRRIEKKARKALRRGRA